VDNPVISEIPLDLGFCGVFTVLRPGQRTPTGAVRAEFRRHGFDRVVGFGPRRRRGAAEPGRGTVFTGHLRPGRRATVGNGESASEQATAMASGQTGPTGNRRQRRPAGPLGQPRGVGEADRAHGRPWATESWFGADGSGATPTGLGEVGSDWHQDRWLGRPGQRGSVATVRPPGNR
jgi:hypothetical protein